MKLISHGNNVINLEKVCAISSEMQVELPAINFRFETHGVFWPFKTKEYRDGVLKKIIKEWVTQIKETKNR